MNENEITVKADERDLRRIEEDLNKLEEIALVATKNAAEELVIRYKSAAEAVGAVDTGFLRDTIGILTAEEFAAKFVVTSKAEYSAIVEVGREDTPNYPGRFPAARALDEWERRDVFERKLDDALDEFLHDD